MKRYASAAIALAMAIIPSTSYAAYTSVQWGVDRTVPTDAPVCILTGPSCLVEIGRANLSTGAWSISPSAIPTPTASTLGGVFSKTCAASEQFYSLATDGTFSCRQSAFSDISGQATLLQLPTLAATTILGNPTGAGATPVEITLGSTLSFSGTALRTGAGTGDVTWSANSFSTTISANAVTYAKFQQVAANSLVGNPGAALANSQAVALPSCSTSSSALLWTTNTGFSCNTSINAATLGGSALGTSGATVPLLSTANTWSADQTIAKSNPGFQLRKSASGEAAVIYGMLNGTSRWALNIGSAAAESGSNAGSNFGVARYSDAGALLDYPISVARDTGIVTMHLGQIQDAGTYHNWGTTSGSSGYGIRDNGGSIEVKNSGGAWATLATATPPPQGRLTLTSATPVLTTTVSGATTVYYTPYIGNQVPIWNGSTFAVTTFAELSQATTDATKSPAAATTNSNYDLFVWSDSGTVRCTRGPPWTSDTARGTGAGTTELTRVNGIWTNTVAITNGPAAGYGTYVGTIRTNGSSQVDYIFGGSGAGGVASSIGVWNMYNRVSTTTDIQDSTATWAYTTGAWRNADNSATMRHSFIIGMSEDALSAEYASPALSSGGTAAIGVALNSSSPSAKNASFNGTTVYTSMVAFYSSIAPLGWNYLQATEYGSAGGTFVGTASIGGGNFIMTLRN